MLLLKIVILLTIFAAVVHCDPRLRFIFFHGTDIVQTEEYRVDTLQNLINHPNFQRNIPTIMFHYGAGQSISSIPVNDIVISYIFNRGYNFVVIAYEDNSIIGTNTAVDLSEGIATALIRFFDAGYSSGNMNLLGFSLGAQILARASRRVQAISSRRHVIGRLTGLDPFNLTIGRMSSVDAQWVESIHTESPNRGDHSSVGHVQFYFNGGLSQPQCTQINPISRWDCSHNAALIYWAESVRSRTPIFPALQCTSWDAYLSGICNDNSVGHMGRTTESHLRGGYFLRTNLTPPFSRSSPLP